MLVSREEREVSLGGGWDGTKAAKRSVPLDSG